jgi:integrase
MPLQLRGDSYRVLFRYHGKQHSFPLGAVSEIEAQAKAAQVDYLLLRLKQRLIELPAGVSIVDFVRYDGKPPATTVAEPGVTKGVTKAVSTLSAFRDRYLATHRDSLEERTVDGIELHFKHLCRVLGAQFPIRELKLADLQDYVDRRAKAKGIGGKRLSPATIKKEIITLRTAWNWAAKMGIVAGRFPYDGLRYPKGDEKPPFQTMDEIDRQISASGLKAAEQQELWEALYLRSNEVAELLSHVEQHAAHPWILPLVCMAAHTGARRSELIRMQVADVDLAGGTVVIRERKRLRGKRSTRRAPMTPLLRRVLTEWLAVHPGGPALFCHAGEVYRSSKRSRTTGHQSGKQRATTMKGRRASIRPRPLAPVAPLTASECHDHVKRTLADSKWSNVRGLHVLRHSMISCMAAAGIDQRIIDDIVGHTSEEMRRRYRHLTPQLKSQAVLTVFSGPSSEAGPAGSAAGPPADSAATHRG